MMYEELNCFEEALKHFGTRVEVICAMELGGRINPEDAYQMIKDEMKEVKKCRKKFKKEGAEMDENFDYKSYSLEHLEEWVNDSLNVDEASAKEIYDRITQTIKDNIKHHQYELKKAQELLRMMTPSQKDLEREYNKREIEYYNKRGSFRCWQS